MNDAQRLRPGWKHRIRLGWRERRVFPILVLSSCLAIATLLTFWLAFWATRQWKQSTASEARARGGEAVALVAEALDRDMKGGQTSLLLWLNEPMLDRVTLYDLADQFAKDFARFPYVESFFIWRNEGRSGAYVFNRANRLPPWDDAADTDPYPVVIRDDPAAVRPLVARVQQGAGTHAPFALVEMPVSGVPYQAFVHYFYQGRGAGARLSAIVGFVVNLDWARQYYFSDVIAQIQTIIGDPAIGIAITDEQNRTVAAVGPPVARASAHVRTFPALFADRAALTAPDSPDVPTWTAMVDVTSRAGVYASSLGTTLTLTLLALATLAAFVALAFTVRAASSAAELATAQSEFVSSVSHEMRTPLSLIRLTSNALASRRYESPDTIAEYTQLLSTEAVQLTRLIDNVLWYARFTNTRSEYHLERVDASELAQECVRQFRPELDMLGFNVHLDLPLESSDMYVDRVLVHQVFDNLIDNAVKHAAAGRQLIVSVEPDGGWVRIVFTDAGPGISPEELPRVFDKFYRGSRAKGRGTGLGLAIVRRIVEDQGGHVAVRSDAGRGTSVSIVFPAPAAERSLDPVFEM